MSARVTGEATYTVADMLSAAYFGRVRWLLACFAMFGLTMGYQAWIDGIEDVEDLIEIIRLPLIILAVGAVLFAVFLWWVLRRLSMDQRRVAYEIDDINLQFRNGAGVMAVYPWSGVKGCKEHRSGIALFLKPMGSGWLIKRAFTKGDLQALRALARSHLGKAARLRGEP